MEKIIWAVDALADDKALQEAAASLIRVLACDAGVQIQPVYIFKGYPVEGATATPADLIDRVQAAAQEGFAEVLAGLDFTGKELSRILPIILLTEPYVPMHKGVRRLIDFSEDQDADLIVVSTHARKGLGRLYLGSFAESLVLHSPVPVLTVNPECERVQELKEILFPTDFSEESRDAFRSVLDLAKNIGSKVVLFHKIGNRELSRWERTLFDMSVYQEFFRQSFSDACAKRSREAERWVRDENANDRVEILIDSRPEGSSADAILAEAEKRKCMIAMAGRSGKSNVLLGSSTRKVIRNSPVPVWVLHPQSARTARSSVA
jgi:nucleotide-binding universal stress UspA family protein